MGWKRASLIVVIVILIAFSIGAISLTNKQIPASFFSDKEISSPSDWVKEKQIKVYGDRIVLDIKKASWASFTDTNSMDPFLDETTNAIEIMPDNPDQINVGDVIAYQSSYGVIVHRVIEKNEDENGPYFIVKGDNNQAKDLVKVRFKDIKGVVVAVIY